MASERQVVVARQTQAASSFARSGEANPVPGASAPGTDLPLKDESESLAVHLVLSATSAGTPVDQLRAMADNLLKAYRAHAARRNPLGGRMMDHIRDRFNARLDM